MRKYGSHIAASIDREYKEKLAYQRRNARVNCKEKECSKCQFQYICCEGKYDT